MKQSWQALQNGISSLAYISDEYKSIRRSPMKRLLMAVMLATMTMPVFALAAAAAAQDRPYRHESACMYQGYPCSEWTRDDGW
jgi:hypothetical protein